MESESNSEPNLIEGPDYHTHPVNEDEHEPEVPVIIRG